MLTREGVGVGEVRSGEVYFWGVWSGEGRGRGVVQECTLELRDGGRTVGFSGRAYMLTDMTVRKCNLIGRWGGLAMGVQGGGWWRSFESLWNGEDWGIRKVRSRFRGGGRKKNSGRLCGGGRCDLVGMGLCETRQQC